MADWTNIQNANIEPGAPALSSVAFAFRDNPVAIAEGAAGAPRVQNAAIANSAVTTLKLETAERMTTANVASNTAGLGRGAVGSYAFLALVSGGSSGGDTKAGSGLSYASATSEGGVSSTGSPSGTWRNMGNTLSTGSATVFLRIS